MHSRQRDLVFRGIEDLLQPALEILRDEGEPACIDETYAEKVAQIDAVLVSKGGKFHPHEGSERDEAKLPGVFAFADGGIWLRLIGPGFLSGEQDADAIRDFTVFAIEKNVHGSRLAEGGYAPMGKSVSCHCSHRLGEVFAMEQKIHTTRISNSGFIGSRDPGCDGVSADHGIRHLRAVQCRCGPEQPDTNHFNRIAHAKPGNREKGGHYYMGSSGHPWQRVRNRRKLDQPATFVQGEGGTLPSRSFFSQMKASLSAVVLLLSMSGLSLSDIPVKVTYDEHVLPIFRNACLNCHNPDKKKAGLDLSTYQGTLLGSENGKVVQSGNAGGSLLFKCVKGTEEPKMPPKGDRLTEAELGLVEKWIATQLLETATGQAVAAAANNVQVAVVSLERPAGPPPMPGDLPLEPFVRTVRANALTALGASPWAPLVAVGGQRQIILYNTETLEALGILPFPEGFPAIIRFSRNGELLLTGGGLGGKSGKVVLWDVKTGARIATIGNEVDQVLAADLTADQQFVALGGPNKLVKIYSTKDGRLIHSLKKHTDWVTALAYSPNGKFLATADRNGGLQIWEGDTGKEFNSLAGHKGSVTGVSFMTGVVASASEDGTVKLWDSKEGKEIKSWEAHKGGVQSVEFSPDGRLVSSGRDKRARVWDQTGKQLLESAPFADIALRAELSNERVVAGDWTGQIRVFAIDGKPLGELSSNPPSIAERIVSAKKRLADLQAVQPDLELAFLKAEQSAGSQPVAPVVAEAAPSPVSDGNASKVAELTKRLEQQTAEVVKLREARGGTAQGSGEYEAANALVQAKKAEIAQTQSELGGTQKTSAEVAKVEPVVSELVKTKTALEDGKTQIAAAEHQLTRWARAEAFMSVHQTRLSLVEKQARHDELAAAVKNAFSVSEQLRTDLAAAEKTALALPGNIKKAQADAATAKAAAAACEAGVGAAEIALKQLEDLAKTVMAPVEAITLEIAELTKKLEQQTAEIARRREVRATKSAGTPEYAEADTQVQSFKPEIAQTESVIQSAKSRLAGDASSAAPSGPIVKAREALATERLKVKPGAEQSRTAEATLANLLKSGDTLKKQIADLRQNIPRAAREGSVAKAASEKALVVVKRELETAKVTLQRTQKNFESRWPVIQQVTTASLKGSSAES